MSELIPPVWCYFSKSSHKTLTDKNQLAVRECYPTSRCKEMLKRGVFLLVEHLVLLPIG